MFDVGDRVVCVDAGPKKGSVGAMVPIHHLLREGQVYTIAAITYGAKQVNLLTGESTTVFVAEGTLSLAEVTPPPPMKGFAAYRFRKIDPSGEALGREAVTGDLVEG